jgi:hypothetical protein
VVWSQGALTGLDQIYNDKHGFEILVNTDAKQIAASDEVTSVLRPALQAFSAPDCRCPVRLGIPAEESQAAVSQTDALRAAEKAKASTQEAIRALFDEVVAAQPPPPAHLRVHTAIYSGYSDDLHLKADEALESTFVLKEEAAAPAPASSLVHGDRMRWKILVSSVNMLWHSAILSDFSSLKAVATGSTTPDTHPQKCSVPV